MQEKAAPSKPSDLGFSEAVSSIFNGESVKVAQDSATEKAQSALGIVRALTSINPLWIEWEPETLWEEMRRAFGRVPSDAVKGKVQAVKTLLVSDAFWRDHLAFEKIVVALNGASVLFDQYQQPSPGQIAYALKEAASIRSAPFTDEVLRYVATVCFEDGLILLPEPLDVAQDSLDEMADPIVGRQLKADIAKRWLEAKLNGRADGLYTETITGIQLARMRAIQECAGVA
jgi:hypothetical protein